MQRDISNGKFHWDTSITYGNNDTLHKFTQDSMLEASTYLFFFSIIAIVRNWRFVKFRLFVRTAFSMAHQSQWLGNDTRDKMSVQLLDRHKYNCNCTTVDIIIHAKIWSASCLRVSLFALSKHMHKNSSKITQESIYNKWCHHKQP